MENIFFDLDGTLIESKPRLYQLFQYMVPASKLSFDEYWAYKRNKVTHKEILQDVFSYTLADISKFEKEWLERIELAEWLVLDEPFEGVTQYLKKLSYTYKIFIVTSRQFENRALDQINQFGWNNIVERVFVTGQKLEKHELITQSIKITSQDWFIGDTGKDIQTGKLLGMNTAAVLSGFLSKGRLLEYRPDLIVDNVISLSFK